MEALILFQRVEFRKRGEKNELQIRTASEVPERRIGGVPFIHSVVFIECVYVTL